MPHHIFKPQLPPRVTGHAFESLSEYIIASTRLSEPGDSQDSKSSLRMQLPGVIFSAYSKKAGLRLSCLSPGLYHQNRSDVVSADGLVTPNLLSPKLQPRVPQAVLCTTFSPLNRILITQTKIRRYNDAPLQLV